MMQQDVSLLTRVVGIASLLLVSICSAFAQNAGPVAIYRERGDPFWVNTTPTMFNGSGTIMFEVAGRGVYVVDTVTWRARKVDELDNMPSYEYSTFLQRKSGGMACLQTGSAGMRLWKFDEALNVLRDTLPERVDTQNIFNTIKYHTPVALYFPISRPWATPPVSRSLMSFDGCDSWVDLPVPGKITLLGNDGIGGALTQRDGAKYCALMHPYTSVLGLNKSVLTPILARPIMASETDETFHKAILGIDTIMWIDEVQGKMILGIGALGDTVASFVGSSFQTADGTTVNILKNKCHLLNSATRRVFLVDAIGAVHEYRKGQWHTIDTVRFKTSSSAIYGPEQVYYSAKTPSGASGEVFLQLNDSLVQELRIKSYFDGYNSIRSYPSVHPNVTPFTFNWNGPTVLKMKSGHGYLLSSTLRDIEDIGTYPMLYGFVAQSGTKPFVVSYHGHMVQPESTGAGRLVSATTNGDQVQVSRSFKPAPSKLSTVGLRMASVSATDILAPGAQLMQFDRDGRFLSIVTEQASTSALRIDSSNILIGNGTVVYHWTNGSITDTTDVRPLLVSTDTLESGFIGSMSALNGTTVLAFVSGLHLYDNENLVSRPYRCGGIVRSTDNGQSWKASQLPDQEPYFLGFIRVDSNVLVASYTKVVRDTLKRNNLNYEEERRNETLFTTMEDCQVVRSTDNGVTWTKVYSRPVNKGFRFIGSSGVRLADGRLIINGIDGPLESFDNGLSLDFHDPVFNEPTDVITFFTDDAAEDIYYCTTTGVFKNRLVTSSVEDQQINHSTNQPAEARRWNSHLAAWTNEGYTCTALTTLLGEMYSPLTAPSPGVYVARLVDQSGRVTTRKIMVVEE
ncbi:MAG: WD40/YVTN/BNR-like repeat-containing protein [Ignavibacteria bacterium]